LHRHPSFFTLTHHTASRLRHPANSLLTDFPHPYHHGLQRHTKRARTLSGTRTGLMGTMDGKEYSGTQPFLMSSAPFVDEDRQTQEWAPD
jgi:phage gp29-like protein